MTDNPVLSSFQETIKHRLGSTMYGSFFISWCGWNWKPIYVTFFVDQTLVFQLNHQLKLDYILAMYSSENLWSFGMLWIISKLFLLPAFSAYLIVWQFSKIEYLFFKEHLINRLKKEKETIEQRRIILTKEKEVLRRVEENAKIEKQIEKEKTSFEDKWQGEYTKFVSKKDFNKIMEVLKQCLYVFDGNIYSSDENGNSISIIDSNNLAFLDVNGLISIIGQYKNKISITEKGKYFLKMHIQEKN